jgi:hypothetical protein
MSEQMNKIEYSQLDKKLDKILRGMYGDKDNRYTGVIQRSENNAKRIAKIESEFNALKSKMIWWTAGAAAGATAVINIIAIILH